MLTGTCEWPSRTRWRICLSTISMDSTRLTTCRGMGAVWGICGFEVSGSTT
jgi:hypothetical protein